MLDHVSFGVPDLERAAAFYNLVLAPLGMKRVLMFDETSGSASAGYAIPGTWEDTENTPFWLEERRGAEILCPPGLHVCFRAPDRAAVHAFYAAGLAAGATDNGAPGPRPVYGPNYYAAFLVDIDGWRIEAVTFSPT